MRAKLVALREGRIASDEELKPLLEDTNLEATAGQEEPEPSVPPEEDGEDEDGEDDVDDEQIEGEIVAEETQLGKEVNEMDNVMQQSKEHQSESIANAD